MKTMNNSPVLAIDFGTSRTKVAYFDENKQEPRLVDIGRAVRDLIPSIFYLPQEEEGEIMVGDDAEEMVEHDPGGIVVALKREIHKPGKLWLGDGRKSDRVELASHLFRHIKKFTESNVPYFQGKSIDTCTLTVPVCFSTPQREAIQRAAERGGFRKIQIMEEPVAAARSWLWETHLQGIKSVIVCDIGGGTTDFAAVRLERGEFLPIPEIPTGGFTQGGDDVDDAIVDLFRDEDKESNTHHSEFWAKLSNIRAAFKTKIRKIKEFAVRAKREQFVHLEGEKLTVPPETINRCIVRFVDQVGGELENYLKTCHEKLGDEKPPILLVGGSSKLSGLEDRIKQITGDLPVYRWEHSDYAIVLGAATLGNNIVLNSPEQSDTLQDSKKEPAFRVVGGIPVQVNNLDKKSVTDQSGYFQNGGLLVTPEPPTPPPPNTSPVIKSAFFEALQKVDIGAVKVCVQSDIDVNMRDDNETPALCIAINGRDEEEKLKAIVDYLLQNNAIANVVDKEGKTPLHHAIINGYSGIAGALVQDTDVNIKDYNGNTPLHTTVIYRQPKLFEMLLNHGADVNIANKDGYTPLHLMIKDALIPQIFNPQMIKALIEYGADVNIVDNEGNTPLHRIIKHYWSLIGLEEILEVLMNHGADVNIKNNTGGNTPLHSMVKKNWNPQLFETLMKHGADINTIDNKGNTPLHTMIKRNWNPSMFDILVNHAANVNIADNEGNTPLHTIIKNYRSFDVFETLLNHGADANIADNEGNTPLHITIKNNLNSEVFEALINHDTNVNIPDNEGDTPLHTMIKRNWNPSMFGMLVNHGADVNIADYEGNAPLHTMINTYWEVQPIATLLQHGANRNAKDRAGRTPRQLTELRMFGKSEILKLL